jgi:hypothetical protein
MTEPTQMTAKDVQDRARMDFPTLLAPKNPDPQKKIICIALLSYDAKLYTKTHMCLVNAVMQAAQRGWGVTFAIRDGDSMVARGRNYLASQFLEHPTLQNCTDLVMVDSDLGWDGDEFMRLCEDRTTDSGEPVEVIGGAYPFKDESGDMPLRWPPDGLMEEKGLWQVQAVTPGFLRVTRRALQKIANEMPWLEYKDKPSAVGQRSWMFFDNLQRPSGVYDEGYVFCERWRQVGGKVWLDPDMNITHIGLKSYNHGTIRGWLDKKSETFKSLEAEYPGVPALKLMQKAMGENIDLEAERPKKDAHVFDPSIPIPEAKSKTRRKPRIQPKPNGHHPHTEA